MKEWNGGVGLWTHHIGLYIIELDFDCMDIVTICCGCRSFFFFKRITIYSSLWLSWMLGEFYDLLVA